MLIDWHAFQFHASVPWPKLEQAQVDWARGIHSVEDWLEGNIGSKYKQWAWSDSEFTYNIGVAFRWDQDRLLFVMVWS